MYFPVSMKENLSSEENTQKLMQNNLENQTKCLTNLPSCSYQTSPIHRKNEFKLSPTNNICAPNASRRLKLNEPKTIPR